MAPIAVLKAYLAQGTSPSAELRCPCSQSAPPSVPLSLAVLANAPTLFGPVVENHGSVCWPGFAAAAGVGSGSVASLSGVSEFQSYVGVALGVGVGLALGVALGVGVGVGADAGCPIIGSEFQSYVGVALGVGVGVGMALSVGVGTGVFFIYFTVRALPSGEIY